MKQLGTDFLNPLVLRKLRVPFGEVIFFGQWTKPSEAEISKDRRKIENREGYNINHKKKNNTEHVVFCN